MTVTVLGIGAAAFVVSFGAIAAYAAASGGIDKEHAYLAPLFVDGFTVVAALADVWFAATRPPVGEGWGLRMTRNWPKVLLTAAAAGSFLLNVGRAPAAGPARVVAALAPLALLLSVELLTMLVRHAVALRLERHEQMPAASVSRANQDRLVSHTPAAGVPGAAMGAAAAPSAALAAEPEPVATMSQPPPRRRSRRPAGQPVVLIREAREELLRERPGQPPTLRELAERAGLSYSHTRQVVSR